MKKPNIYVFTTAYDPFIGGAEISIAYVTDRLRSDFDFVVVTARLRKNLARREEKDGLTIMRIGMGHPILDKFFLPFLAPFSLMREFRRLPPALFWCVMVSYAAGAAYIWNLFARRRVPVVLTLQEGDSPRYLMHGRLGLLGLSWRAALSWQPPEVLTGLSAYLIRFARDVGYVGEARVVPNGVDIEEFRPEKSAAARKALRAELGLSKDAKIIISTSRLVEKNAVDTLIEAATLLKHRDTYVVVLGDGPERTKLEELVARHRLQGRVFLLGSRRHEDLPRYLANADIFVRVSRSEGQGISFVEAMAAGIPVIATPVGGIVDFVFDRKTGLLVPPDRPEELAHAIDELLENRGLRGAIAREALTLAEARYTWDRIAEEYREVFENHLSRNRAVLIASGIYPPEVGGTAGVAEMLFRQFKARHWRASLLTYGGKRPGLITVPRYPTGVRHLAAFFVALRALPRHDAVLLLDHFSIGFPVALAARLLGNPYAVRVGGDFLWESYVETRRRALALPDFYQAMPHLSIKERVILSSARWTLQHATRIAFTTEWQREIFLRAYRLSRERTVIIANPCLPLKTARLQPTKEVIYAGRLIFLKNLERLIVALRDVPQLSLALIGEGPEVVSLQRRADLEGLSRRVMIVPPMSQALLRERIARARAVAIPSYSDISPNIALEALSLGTPVILTRYSGYANGEETGVLRIEPDDTGSLRAALLKVADDAAYKKLQKQAATFVSPVTPEDVGGQYESLMEKLL